MIENSQECVRQDTGGMRGKARRADKNDESRNRNRKEKCKTGIRKGVDEKAVSPYFYENLVMMPGR